MKYFLGLDGGASKSEVVIIDEDEKVLAQVLGEPVNYHQDGQQETRQNLEEVIKKALVQAHLKVEEMSWAVFGLAGFDTETDKKILSEIAKTLMDGSFASRVDVISDVEIAFASCIERDYGIVLISGTGANCFAKGKNGKVAWTGDWGWLLGDQASGFALGLGALKTIMRSFDGRGEPATILSKLILDKLNLKAASQLNNWVYQKETPVKEIASLAPLVFAAYKKGDKVAFVLVKKLIYEMVLDIKTVASKTGLTDEDFGIGLVGGIFKEGLVVELLEKDIKKILPKAKLALPRMIPAMAAAKIAIESRQ